MNNNVRYLLDNASFFCYNIMIENLYRRGVAVGAFTVGIYTLGCKVSQYESEAIKEAFSLAGWEVLPFSEACDAYVINTCTVTAESDRKCRQIIRRAIAKSPNAKIAVIGCYGQLGSDEIAKIGGVDIILGTDGKMSVVGLISNIMDKPKSDKPYISVTDLSEADFEPMCVKQAPRTRAYVKIEDGCESRCTYCAIKDARGRVRSKPREEVISEVLGLYRSGTREIVLTGIETGAYGKDFKDGYGLADLILELDALCACERLRLGSLAPELVGEEFARRVMGAKVLAPHFHLSLQSGSDAILARMKRKYNSDMAYRVIDSLRKYIKGAQLTTDLMVGFPGETEEDFQRTVELVRRVGFIDAHIFAYSRRPGTPAADYDGQIPESVKRQRSRILIEEARLSRDRVLSELVAGGKELRCIAETVHGDEIEGHSDEFACVRVPAGAIMPGESFTVIPVSHKDGVIYGKSVEKI